MSNLDKEVNKEVEEIEVMEEKVENVNDVNDEVNLIEEDEMDEVTQDNENKKSENLKQSKAPEKVNVPRFVESNFGVKSQEVIDSEEEAVNNRSFIELLGYKRNNTLLWVKVSSVEVDKNSKRAFAVALWDNLRIIIPDVYYFMPNYSFGEDYEKLSAKEQSAIRLKAMNYQVGAKVCVVLEQVSSALRDGNRTEYGIIGNRVKAMEMLQYHYFKDKNISERHQIKQGDILKANVLSVNIMNVLVECLGVETRIDRFNISNEVVTNCHEVVSVGDEINVRVRKVHPNQDSDDLAYLTVSARVQYTDNIREKIKVNSVYYGTVTKYNKERDLYTITLKNNINVICLRKNAGKQALKVGDQIGVLVYSIKENYALGRVVGLVQKK